MAVGELSFAFDPETDTPQSVARRRAIAEALMGKALRTPKNVGEGLHSIGNALLMRQLSGRADEAEQAGRSSASEAFSGVFDGLFGGGDTPAPDTGSADQVSALDATADVAGTAPASSGFGGSQQEFIDMIMPGALAASERTGVDPRIIVAQAAQETGWGRSAPGNNFFGIKSHGQEGGQTLNTHEYVNGERVNVADSFRAYEDPQESALGYADFILENPRYRPFMAAQGLEAQLEELGNSGYATDPNYASSVGQIARGITIPDNRGAGVEQGLLRQPSGGGDVDPGLLLEGAGSGNGDPGLLVGGPESDSQSTGLPVTPEMRERLAALSSGDMAINLPISPEMRAPQNPEDMAQRLPNLNPTPAGPDAVQTLPNIGAPAPEGTELAQTLPNFPQGAPPNVGFGAPEVQAPAERVAQAMGGGAGPQGAPGANAGQQLPSVQDLMTVAQNPWLPEGQRSVVNALLEQQFRQFDPAYQLELRRAQAELNALENPAREPIEVGGVLLDPETYDPIIDTRAPTTQTIGNAIIDTRTGQPIYEAPVSREPIEIGGVLLDPDTYEPLFDSRQPSESASQERISRLSENLMATGDFVDPQDAQNIAIGIVDGRLKADRHPVTGELQVVDMATGQPAYQSNRAQPGPAPMTSEPDPAVTSQFGTQFPATRESFGAVGAIQGGINAAGDALGVGAPFPEVQQTQADFGVLRESLLNDMQSAYSRQPPSWLLKDIRNLTPQAGNPFQGPAAAQSQLNAIGRQLQSELQVAQQSLNERELSPTNRQELEARVTGLEAGINRVQTALDSFGSSGQPPAVNSAEEYEALPSGTEYTAPDGTVRRKP